MKYIAYCRKSTDEPDKQILSIDSQVQELKEFAKKENLEVIDFITESKTAKKPGRAKFDQVLKLIEQGKANGIIAWHPDRLARNSVDGGQLVYLLDTGQLQSLKFPTFWFENTPQGRFMLGMAFSQAKYYVDNLSENVKRGIRYKLQKGILPNKAPTGYLNNPVTREIDLNLKVSKFVKQAFRLFATGKYTFVGIQKFLFNHQVTGKTGKPIKKENVKLMLQNPFYYGLIKFNGETYPGTHQPIISKSLFDQCQQVAVKRSKPNIRNYQTDFAFLGLAKCSDCGSAITAERHTKFYRRTNRKAVYRYYRCGKKFGVCDQPYILAGQLEDQIRTIVFNYSLLPQNGQKLLEKINNPRPYGRGFETNTNFVCPASFSPC